MCVVLSYKKYTLSANVYQKYNSICLLSVYILLKIEIYPSKCVFIANNCYIEVLQNGNLSYILKPLYTNVPTLFEPIQSNYVQLSLIAKSSLNSGLKIISLSVYRRDKFKFVELFFPNKTIYVLAPLASTFLAPGGALLTCFVPPERAFHSSGRVFPTYSPHLIRLFRLSVGLLPLLYSD